MTLITLKKLVALSLRDCRIVYPPSEGKVAEKLEDLYATFLNWYPVVKDDAKAFHRFLFGNDYDMCKAEYAEAVTTMKDTSAKILGGVEHPLPTAISDISVFVATNFKQDVLVRLTEEYGTGNAVLYLAMQYLETIVSLIETRIRL